MVIFFVQRTPFLSTLGPAGPIPAVFGKLVKLVELDLSMNDLTSKSPFNVAMLPLHSEGVRCRTLFIVNIHFVVPLVSYEELTPDG